MLRLSCKQSARLLVEREDRPLGWLEGLGLRLHLMACEACPRFERQVLTMRNAMRQWRNYSDE